MNTPNGIRVPKHLINRIERTSSPIQPFRPAIPLWEDRPFATMHMDFRQHEAEMAALRSEETAPSPLNTKPGCRVRINEGWSAPWLTDPVALETKSHVVRNRQTSPPVVSYWRSLSDVLESGGGE